MSLDQLAKEIAASLARHQSRGLVDDAKGMTDVVIHGRVDLLGVANEVLMASIVQLKPVRKSWSGWFMSQAAARRRFRKYEREVEKLAERMECAGSEAEAAIARLKSRELRP